MFICLFRWNLWGSRGTPPKLPTTFTARHSELRVRARSVMEDDASRLVVCGILLGGEAVEHVGVAFRAAM